MTQDKDQMRAEFEDWMVCTGPDYSLLRSCICGDDYEHPYTQKTWEGWQAAQASASKQSETPTHAMFKRVFRHGVVRDWQVCSVEYANYILSNPERFGDTEVKFLKEV